MTLAAGELNQRIMFQRQQQATDPDYGGPVGDPVWAEVVTVWAKRTNNLRANDEAAESGTIVAVRRVRFDIRARPIDAAWRIVGQGGDHDGVIYDITSIGDSNDRSETAILAESGANRG